jgi:hypothetical protein
MNGVESSHLFSKWSELMLDIYDDLISHQIGNVKCLADPVKNQTTENAGLSKKDVIRKKQSIVCPRVSLLAAWDVLRIRLKSYASSSAYFGIIKVKKNGAKKKKKRRGRWIDLSKQSFVSSTYIKMNELSHIAQELQSKQDNINIYIDNVLPGKRERTDAHKVSNLAINLFDACEIILDACREASSRDTKKTLEAAKILFQASDKDHNGILTLEEFQSMMRKAGARPSHHDLSDLYNNSSDIDGNITADSFAAALQFHIEKCGMTKSMRKFRRTARKLNKSNEHDSSSQEQKDIGSDKEDDNNVIKVEEKKQVKEVEELEEKQENEKKEQNQKNIIKENRESVSSNKFTCVDCGRSFVRKKGLDYHRNECKMGQAAASLAATVSNKRLDSITLEVAAGESSNEDDSSDDDETLTIEETNDFNWAKNLDNDELTPIEGGGLDEISRNLLTQICYALNERDNTGSVIDLNVIWNKLTGGNSYLDLRTFQLRVSEVAGFYPSNRSTSSLWLLLDEDRSGWIEEKEFHKFAEMLLNQNGELKGINDFSEDDRLRNIVEQPSTHLSTHIDDSNLDGWELLLLSWKVDEDSIRQLVHDYGGHDEKLMLVLLDELTEERVDIHDAWDAFKSLCVFKSRMNTNEI